MSSRVLLEPDSHPSGLAAATSIKQSLWSMLDGWRKQLAQLNSALLGKPDVPVWSICEVSR